VPVRTGGGEQVLELAAGLDALRRRWGEDLRECLVRGVQFQGDNLQAPLHSPGSLDEVVDPEADRVAHHIRGQQRITPAGQRIVKIKDPPIEVVQIP